MPDDDTLLGWTARLHRGLRGAGVPHALAGGLALAIWARPRATIDIDLVIAADPDAVAATRAACAEAGLLQTRRRVTRFKRVSMLRMAVPPTRTRETIAVDLLLPPDDLATPLLRRAVGRRVLGATVPVATAEDIVLLKLLRMSEQDRADIRAIRDEQRLDRGYLLRRAKQLRILTRLRAVGLR